MAITNPALDAVPTCIWAVQHGLLSDMPNLQDVMDNPQLLAESIERMMKYRETRGEVCLNHGIRTSEELDALVSKAPKDDDVDVNAYRRLLEIPTE